MSNELHVETRCADEWALAVFWSLAGLDLTLWLLAKGALVWSGDVFNVLMPM